MRTGDLNPHAYQAAIRRGELEARRARFLRLMCRRSYQVDCTCALRNPAVPHLSFNPHHWSCGVNRSVFP